MKNTNRVIGLVAVGVLSLPAASPAAMSHKNGAQPEVRLNVGRLNGKSGEYVYDAFGTASGIPGYKVSELDWQLNDVYMAGFGFSANPASRLRINVDYWSNIGDGNGTMDDYDWMYVGLDWSHWSHHDNTTVNTATSLDINGEFTLYDFAGVKTTLTGLLGYKQDKLAWQSVGGYGIYSDVANGGYRDLIVTFPNSPVINYEQKFNMPYIGVGVRSVSDSASMPVVLSASLRYSTLVHGQDVDNHILRSLRFEESGDNGKWMAADVRVDFTLTPRTSLNLAYAMQRYSEIKAATTVTDLTTGAVTYYPGPSAGLDHRSNMLSLGLVYKF